jgi:hypothetical protein
MLTASVRWPRTSSLIAADSIPPRRPSWTVPTLSSWPYARAWPTCTPSNPDQSPKTCSAPACATSATRSERSALTGPTCPRLPKKPTAPTDIEALRQELEAEIERSSDERRKALARAFVSDLVVEERGTIQPTFYVRGKLSLGISGATDELPSDGKGFRAMTHLWWTSGLRLSRPRTFGAAEVSRNFSKESADMLAAELDSDALAVDTGRMPTSHQEP